MAKKRGRNKSTERWVYKSVTRDRVITYYGLKAVTAFPFYGFQFYESDWPDCRLALVRVEDDVESWLLQHGAANLDSLQKYYHDRMGTQFVFDVRLFRFDSTASIGTL